MTTTAKAAPKKKKARRKLTEAQKLRRKANRDKFFRKHIEAVFKGDMAKHPETSRSYYQEAQTYWEKYKENGGRG